MRLLTFTSEGSWKNSALCTPSGSTEVYSRTQRRTHLLEGMLDCALRNPVLVQVDEAHLLEAADNLICGAPLL